ncbi:MAG: membrane protein insertion efficiency factor YidD [Pseudomonadota bacterium]
MAGADTTALGAVARLLGKAAQRALLGLLAFYRLVLSPIFYFLGARCRHEPSCSAYAQDAIRLNGPGRGLIMAIARLSRCHPFGSSGFDPAPRIAARHGWRIWRYGDWAWRERAPVDAGASGDDGNL